MAEFSGKIVSVCYADSEYSIVKVLYDDNGKLTPYHLETSLDDPAYKDLLDEGWDEQKIAESTAEIKKAESRAFNALVNEAAGTLLAKIEKENKRALDKIGTEIESYFDFILNNGDDKDNLFKWKLWALETPLLETATKEQKSKIRRCKHIIEGFDILLGIKNSEE